MTFSIYYRKKVQGMHDPTVLTCLFLLLHLQVPLIVSKIILSRVKPIHISRIATLCLDEFFDPQTTSQSSYKRERLWICQHLESKSKSPRAFFVAQYVNETKDGAKHHDVDAPVVGFVEIAMSSEYNRILSNYDESSTTVRLPFREQRPKISALVVDRNYRRLGIGGLLISACTLQACKWTSHGVDEMFLDVAADNTIAYSFYRSLGFITCPSPCQKMTGDTNDRPVGNIIRLPMTTINKEETPTAKVIIMYKVINCD